MLSLPESAAALVLLGSEVVVARLLPVTQLPLELAAGTTVLLLLIIVHGRFEATARAAAHQRAQDLR